MYPCCKLGRGILKSCPVNTGLQILNLYGSGLKTKSRTAGDFRRLPLVPVPSHWAEMTAQ